MGPTRPAGSPMGHTVPAPWLPRGSPQAESRLELQPHATLPRAARRSGTWARPPGPRHPRTGGGRGEPTCPAARGGIGVCRSTWGSELWKPHWTCWAGSSRQWFPQWPWLQRVVSASPALASVGAAMSRASGSLGPGPGPRRHTELGRNEEAGVPRRKRGQHVPAGGGGTLTCPPCGLQGPC